VFRCLFHIARNTFRECVRQPIYVILLLTANFIIYIHPLAAMYVFREQEKLVTDGSLATVLLFGWITAVLCASHTIAREIDTGTVLLILSKPVNRAWFILAKILGILAALTIFVYVCAIGTLLNLRIATDQFQIDVYVSTAYLAILALACVYGVAWNYFRRRSFAAHTLVGLVAAMTLLAVVTYFLPAFDMGYQWGTAEHPYQPGRFSFNLGLALVLILFAVWAMGTLATALSTQFALVANLTICAVIFVVGLVSDYLFFKLTSLRYDELLRLSHGWLLLLHLPFILGWWLLAGKHYATRRNPRIPAWSLHATFAAIALATLYRGLLPYTTNAYLQTPGTALQHLARIVFAIKNHLAEFLHAIIPNWQLFWMADALAAKTPIPPGYLLLGLGYIIAFIVVFCLLAYVLFINREVGKQMVR
jgi:ABC-type transport system involved in multi-copper enzyme maturation permease subunit